jgi:DNA-binding response OmpR family regulator
VISPTNYAFDRQRIVVAEEESVTATRIIAALRHDGHCVAHEPTAFSDPDSLAVAQCQLMITSMRVEGVVRMDILKELRDRLPALTVLYLSNGDSLSVDPPLPDRLPVLRAPFTNLELQAEVRRLLPQLRSGTVLARHSGEMARVIDRLDPVARQASGLG